MNRSLVLEVRFVVPAYHGRCDFGEPEWPPSPHRAFQAWVAAAARAGQLAGLRAAFRWLERLGAPVIAAPEVARSPVGYRLSVPHNAMDLIARGWVQGADPEPAKHRTMKAVRPLHLPDDCTVRYAWPLPVPGGGEPAPVELDLLLQTARSIIALGWGCDLAVAHAETRESTPESGSTGRNLHVWIPRTDGALMLRVPTAGSAQEMEERHQAFLGRLSLGDTILRPVPAVVCHEHVAYARNDDPPRMATCAFTLLRPDGSAMKAFDTAREGTVVVGRMRHAARQATKAAGWSEEVINSAVLGHGDASQARLQWLPVPSIEPRPGGGSVVSAIRRVVVAAAASARLDLPGLARALSGQGLVDEDTGDISALLAPAVAGDRTLERYCAPSRTWATVTPVVLPGHDDPGGLRKRLRAVRNAAEQRELLERLAVRRDHLLRKALCQSGVPPALVATARIDAREAGYIAGVDMAQRHFVPRHLQRWPRFHVRLTFDRPILGPLCVGGGRFYGLGLFAIAVAGP